MPENEIAKRIFKLADKKYPEQKDFAAAISTTPSIVSQWRNDITTSYKKRLDVIASVLDTTVDYLLTGEKKEPTVQDDGFTEEERLLVLAYRAASEDDRAVVDAALRKYKPTASEKKAM